jgi:hypothetical protein
MDGISDHSRDSRFVRDADIPARGARQREEGAEAPAGSGSMSRGFCLEQLTPSQLRVEAMVELMTARLAELVNAEN